ncbi:pinin/SDK/memA/ protein conserved region-domain-containing protein [Phakopsora pachyrhizi]|uniref:Pinin/SDK/memA/ protein conserved region-domain-containing protein n=1 Tax=Phakopsora pachyrhizi TaxID=170000 RepID=A0AAV0AMK4_PHAPC|nr:pinin/SDK/memA/ protein conserved region-domain-containing protein [Phakopsora pachyrhizi]CAH7668866.1 pinin/SDK/memA/ protein conserved region-domain-containing protein [Phakopsora pachyrhizi]
MQELGDEPRDSELRGSSDAIAESSSTPVQNSPAVQPSDQATWKAHDDLADSQPRKKPRLSEADKKRSVRMFGALMGTLSRFQDETSKMKQTDAAKRRAEVESRLQAKLKIESEALHKLRVLELEEKTIKQSTLRKAEELGYLTSKNPIRFANKLAFSNYLRTSSPSLKITDNTEPPLNAHLPSHIQGYQIYWLPYKLTPEQKDLIECQRRSTREEVEEAQRLWDEEKLSKQEELEQFQALQENRLAEIEVEKARSRAKKSSSLAPEDVSPVDEPALANVKTEESDSKDASQMRNESSDCSNDHGRDEDAVEY